MGKVLPDRWAPLGVFVAALGVGLWVHSVGDFERRFLFISFAGWIAVATSATGAFRYVKAVTGAGVTDANRPNTD